VIGGDRGFDGLHGPEVPIRTSAFSPESKTVGTGPLRGRQPFQRRAPDGFQEPLDASGRRGLLRSQGQVHADVMGRGLDEVVDAVRHGDRADEPARLIVDGLIKAFHQEMSPSVVRPEWNPPISRRSQLVAFAGLVRSLDGLSMAARGRWV
jgi:hypothetical protein